MKFFSVATPAASAIFFIVTNSKCKNKSEQEKQLSLLIYFYAKMNIRKWQIKSSFLCTSIFLFIRQKKKNVLKQF